MLRLFCNTLLKNRRSSNYPDDFLNRVLIEKFYTFSIVQEGPDLVSQTSVQLRAAASIWRPKPTISRVFSATQPHKGNRIIATYGAGVGNRIQARFPLCFSKY